MKKLLVLIVISLFFISCDEKPKQLGDDRFNGKFEYEEDIQNYMVLKFDGTDKGWLMIVNKGEANSSDVKIHVNSLKDKISMRIWGTGSYIYESVPYKFRDNGKTLEFDNMKFIKKE
ncbi:MAG: hypothetical protein FWG07_04110 [Treponema sp.]|nr:hypothetical protein [Treponema sp.]